MATPKNILPQCGLYLTTTALPGQEERVPAGQIVYFHDHSDSGLPQVLTPDHNIMNRWHFHGPGIEFRGLTWASSLVSLPAEGFYTLKREVTLDGNGKWLKNAIVQLGYTRAGEPILFIAQERAQMQENDLFFSDKGLKISLDDARSLIDFAPIYREPADAGGHGTGHTH